MTDFWRWLFRTPAPMPALHAAPAIAPAVVPRSTPPPLQWSWARALLGREDGFKPMHNEASARKAFAEFKKANCALVQALGYIWALPDGLVERDEGLREAAHAASFARSIFPGPRELLPSPYDTEDLRAFVELAKKAKQDPAEFRDVLQRAFTSAAALIGETEMRARALTLGALNLKDTP